MHKDKYQCPTRTGGRGVSAYDTTIRDFIRCLMRFFRVRMKQVGLTSDFRHSGQNSVCVHSISSDQAESYGKIQCVCIATHPIRVVRQNNSVCVHSNSSDQAVIRQHSVGVHSNSSDQAVIRQHSVYVHSNSSDQAESYGNIQYVSIATHPIRQR